MTSEVEVRVNARMWSRSTSLRPIAARLGTSLVRDKGDPLYSTRGVRLKRLAQDNYLSTEEVRTKDLGASRGEVRRFVRLLEDEPSIARLLDQGTLDAVVWVAIFADEGVVSISDLNIDMAPFGQRLGLVVDNFAEFDRQGIPVKLLIGPAANRKSA